VTGEAWGAGSDWLLDRLPAVVGLHDDPASFRPDHPLLYRLARRSPGLRTPATGGVLAALVPAVLEQRVTSREAHRSWGALVRAYGTPAPGPLGLRLPPSADVLAGLPYYRLHRFGIERQRATTVARVARHARRLEEVVDLPLADGYRRLRAVPGVGAWTAAVVGQVALGDADAVRVGDFHVPHQVAWALAGEPRATDERLLELLEPYRGHRGRVCRLIVSAGISAPARGPRRRGLAIARL
jgi:3-methyladenine DNA glycosylase/8-oxoguanine DNA glycosylase